MSAVANNPRPWILLSRTSVFAERYESGITREVTNGKWRVTREKIAALLTGHSSHVTGHFQMKSRPAAVVFIFITIMLDMLALGLIAPVLPKLILDFPVGG